MKKYFQELIEKPTKELKQLHNKKRIDALTTWIEGCFCSPEKACGCFKYRIELSNLENL